MSGTNYRDLAVEHFWGDEDGDLECQCRGAQVISYLKVELNSVNETMEEYGEDDNTADGRLRKSLIEVINWVCDISDNEDLRVE